MLKKWWQKDGVKILVLYLAWQALILLASFFFTRQTWLTYEPSYPLSEVLAANPLPVFLQRLGGFDGVHYLTIADGQARQVGGVQAFFPLYPVLIRLFTAVLHNGLLSGLLISALSLYGFLYCLFQLIKTLSDRRTAWICLFITLCLPASFFYLTVYSESLFLFLLAAFYLCYYRRRYRWVILLGFLLSCCRIVGIFAVVSIVIDYLYQAWKKHQLGFPAYRQAFLLSLGGLGLVAYMVYLWYVYHDPLAFVHVQSAFGSGRDTANLVFLPQVFYRYLKMFLVGLPLDWKTYSIAQELLLSGLYLCDLGLCFYQNYRHHRQVYPLAPLLFSLCAYLLPTLTGNFSSMPRYLLVCLIINLLLSNFFSRHRFWLGVFLVINTIFCLINLLLFVQGYWVS